MQPVEELGRSFDQMAIVERYERVVAYLYPIAQSIPRRHGVARDMFLACLLGQPDLFFQAGKSNQVSKIYVWPGHKLLRKDSVLRAKRKVANFLHHDDLDGLSKFTASWAGHAQWSESHNLFAWLQARHGIQIESRGGYQ